MAGREPAQLVIHERQQLRRGARVAGLDGTEEAAGLVHQAKETHRDAGRPTSDPEGFTK